MTDFISMLPHKVRRTVAEYEWTVIGPFLVLDPKQGAMVLPVRNLGVTNFAFFDEAGEYGMLLSHEELDTLRGFNHHDYP